MQSIGVEGIPATIGREDPMLGDIIHASIIGLADGDLVGLHTPRSDEEEIRLFGEMSYGDGEVAQKVLEASIANGPNPNAPIYDYQGFLADYFQIPGSPFASQTGRSIAQIHADLLVVDDNLISLPQAPRIVFDFGACLSSRGLIGDQMNMLRTSGTTFTYGPVFRTHFANQVALSEYDRFLGPGGKSAAAEKHIYIGREDGVASTTREIIDSQTAHGSPVDIADIILVLNGQHSSAEDIRTGIENAYPILKTGGTLVTRGLVNVSERAIGDTALAGMAEDAGFVPVHNITYTSTHHHDVSRLLGVPDEAVQMTTRVFTKTEY